MNIEQPNLRGRWPVIAINYHPLVEAVVRGWRRETVGPGSGLGEEQLGDLIVRITNLLEILAASREAPVPTAGSLSDANGGAPLLPR